MILSISDYVLQGIILLLIIVYPWLLQRGQSSRAFGVPFLAIFVWGIWRMVWYDPRTGNDVIGIFYFIVAVQYSLIALLFYGIRCAILRRRAKRENSSDTTA